MPALKKSLPRSNCMLFLARAAQQDSASDAPIVLTAVSHGGVSTEKDLKLHGNKNYNLKVVIEEAKAMC